MISLLHVKAVDRVQESDISLADEVFEGEAPMLVLLGDGNDKAQVGADELLFGDLVSRSRLACDYLLFLP